MKFDYLKSAEDELEELNKSDYTSSSHFKKGVLAALITIGHSIKVVADRIEEEIDQPD